MSRTQFVAHNPASSQITEWCRALNVPVQWCVSVHLTRLPGRWHSNACTQSNCVRKKTCMKPQSWPTLVIGASLWLRSWQTSSTSYPWEPIYRSIGIALRAQRTLHGFAGYVEYRFINYQGEYAAARMQEFQILPARKSWRWWHQELHNI